MKGLFELFFGKPKVEHKYVYNCKKQTDDNRDKYYTNILLLPLPDNIDLRLTAFMPYVLDQGNLGSSVSDASANAVEFCLKKERRIDFSPSRLLIYYYLFKNLTKDVTSQGEWSGCSIRNCLKEIQLQGVCNEKTWPYDISKFHSRPTNKCIREARTHVKSFKYIAIPQNSNDIKQVLANGFPILCGVNVYESFQSNKSITTGNIPMPKIKKEELLGGHAILLCGYDDNTQLFTFQNSWGENLGNKGFFTIPYEYIFNSQLSFDFWTVQYLSSH